MVEYQLIEGQTTRMRFEGHPIGDIKSLLLPERGVDVKEGKAYGAKMSGSLSALALEGTLEGLRQQGILRGFSVKSNNNFKLELDKNDLTMLLERMRINDAPVLKKEKNVQPRKVLLDIFKIETVDPNKTVPLKNGDYILKNLEFKCHFNERPWEG